MAERDRARPAVMDERLGVRPVHAAGRRVARVADRDLAGQRLELLLVEDLGDEPHVAEHRQPASLRDGDPRGLLAAVLQREEREVREPRDVAARPSGCRRRRTWLALTLPGGAQARERERRGSRRRRPRRSAGRATSEPSGSVSTWRRAGRGSPGRTPRRTA